MGNFLVTTNFTWKGNKMIEIRRKRLAKSNITFLGFLYSTIFGLMFMFTKLLLDSVTDEYHLIAFRFIFASLTLTVLIKLNYVKVNFKGKPTKKLVHTNILPIFQSILSVKSLKYIPSSQAGIIVALSPIIVTILSVFMLNEKPKVKTIIFIVLSFTGVIIINCNAFKEGLLTIKGIMLMLVSVFAGSLYTIESRKLFDIYTPMEVCYSSVLMGLIFFNCVSIYKHITSGIIMNYLLPLSNFKALIGLFYIGSIANGFGFLLSRLVLSKVTATKAVIFTNFISVVSIIAGIIFLKESFQLNHIIGAMMILSGVYFTQKGT